MRAQRVAPARFRLCYVVTGTFECLLAGRAPIAVAADHTLRVDDPSPGGAPLAVNPLTADAVALVATIACDA